MAYIPCGSEKEAKDIGKILIEEKLAACANIIPSTSVFEWDNKLEETNEWIVLAKTTPEKFKGLEKKVERVHSYELPAIIGIPVVESNDKYCKWVKDQVK